MSSFRIKVLLFMLPMLLPIGRVDLPHPARSHTPTQLTEPAGDMATSPDAGDLIGRR